MIHDVSGCGAWSWSLTLHCEASCHSNWYTGNDFYFFSILEGLYPWLNSSTYIILLKLEYMASSHVCMTPAGHCSGWFHVFLRLCGVLMQGQCILELTFARNCVGFPLFEGNGISMIWFWEYFFLLKWSVHEKGEVDFELCTATNWIQLYAQHFMDWHFNSCP